MTAPFGINTVITPAGILANVQGNLKQLRNSLYVAGEHKLWLAAYAQTDFTGAPVSLPTQDVSDMFTAVADADAMRLFFLTGQPPPSYPQAVSAYIYAASVGRVVGSLTA